MGPFSSVVKVIDAQSPLTCIDVMPDGATAAVGSTRGKVYIYDLRQGGSTPTHVFSAHKTSVHSVRFMPAGKSKVSWVYYVEMNVKWVHDIFEGECAEQVVLYAEIENVDINLPAHTKHVWLAFGSFLSVS